MLGWGGKMMQRHLAFRSEGELQARLAREAPAHVYHSVAYYVHPSAGKMNEKQWQAADLIFDLDADHLPEMELLKQGKISFGALMEITRGQAVRLAEDFLLGDLGLALEDLQLVFSGGRGYHVHVRAPAVLELPSGARRELADYLTGLDADEERLLIDAGHTRQYGDKRYSTGELRLPATDAPGWQGRVARYASAWLTEAQALPPDEQLARLKSLPGVGSKLAKQAQLDGTPQEVFDTLPRRAQIALRNAALSACAVHADEPVTGDLHRLIRLPGTLHGGTGLLARSVTLDELRDFDPYRQATALGDAPVKVRSAVKHPVAMGDIAALEPGEVAELPATQGAYFMARGFATLEVEA
jgi:DNA primase small subunit